MNALIVGYFNADPLILSFYNDYAIKMSDYGYKVFKYELSVMNEEADLARKPLYKCSILKLLQYLIELPALYVNKIGSIELIEMQAMSKSPFNWLVTYFKMRCFEKEFKQCLIRNDIRHVLLNHQFSGYHILARKVCESLSVSFSYWHPGFLPGTMSFDYTGQLAESELFQVVSRNGLKIKKDWIDLGFEYIKWARGESYIRPGKSNTSNNSILEFVRSKRLYRNLILVVGSNDYRTGVLPRNYKKSDLHSVCYKSSSQLFEDVVAIGCSDSYVIYKPHPNLYSGRSGVEELSESAAIVFDATIRDLLKEVDLSVSICSSAAYEAQIYDVPSIVVGNLPGSNLGFFYWYTGERAGLASIVMHALSKGRTNSQKEIFANFVGYCLSGYFFGHGKYACPLVKHNLNDALKELVLKI